MNGNKKKGCLTFLLIFIAIIIIGGFAITKVIGKKLESFNVMDFTILDMNKVQDGIYTGSADGAIVKAVVEVSVKDHAIKNIKILKHDNGKGKPAEVIINAIIETNSLEVDAVSGATYSSNIIKAAVLDALSK